LQWFHLPHPTFALFSYFFSCCFVFFFFVFDTNPLPSFPNTAFTPLFQPFLPDPSRKSDSNPCGNTASPPPPLVVPFPFYPHESLLWRLRFVDRLSSEHTHCRFDALTTARGAARVVQIELFPKVVFPCFLPRPFKRL